ncbi:MAG: plasmid mobilization relaxosome protein MobC [Eubacteriaceae bacterium]|nr:plasmid mobilization relaxosome protein MobC [Eubacteriaceae bacterium]
MAKRSREKRIEIYISDEEYAVIKQNMERVGTKNLSTYARKMLCDGYIKTYDYAGLRELAARLGEIARSIHQIAKRANQTSNVHAGDYEAVRQLYYEDWAKMKSLISKEISSSRN